MEEISAELRRSGRETSEVSFTSLRHHTYHSQSSRSTSGLKFILLVTVWKINLRSRREGMGNSIFLSRRPGRKRAGSRVS